MRIFVTWLRTELSGDKTAGMGKNFLTFQPVYPTQPSIQSVPVFFTESKAERA